MSELKTLPLSSLQPNPWNRTVFDPQAMENLVSSINVEGVREPLKVRSVAEGKYQIISGHRRWLAAQKAGLTEVPCDIEKRSDEEVAQDNISLNEQRENIPPLELSLMVQAYMVNFNKTVQEAAEAFGKDRTWIAHLLRFARMDPDVIKSVNMFTLSWGPLRAIRKLTTDQQKQIATELQNGSLKPENVQKRCNQLKYGGNPAPTPSNKEVDTPEAGPDPMEETWEKVQDKAAGWMWAEEYQGEGKWQFTVDVGSLAPPDNPDSEPQKYLAQWFLAMAGALGATRPDPEILEETILSNPMAPGHLEKILKHNGITLPKSAADKREQVPDEPSEEEQIRLADEFAAKHGRIG